MRRFALMLGVLLLGAVMLGVVDDAGATGGRPAVAVTRAAQIPTGARKVGAVPGAQSVAGVVVLRPRDEAALTQFIASVTSAGSASFHHYLAAGQFANRFGPTAATVAAVKSQLAADGLRVTSVAGDRLLVGFRGSASKVESAFQTQLANYRLSNGTSGQLTTAAIRVPASIAGVVSGVVGLNTLLRPQPLGIIRGSAAAKRAHLKARAASVAHVAGAPAACSDAQTDAQTFGGLTDDQIANAYGAFGEYNAGDLGAGQHIAIFELEPFLRSDIQTFDTCYFGASQAAQMANRLKVIPVDGGQPTGPGSGEAVLDVEDISAMAPGANIDVYEAPNNVFDNSDFGGLDEYAAIVNNDQDQIVSTSWGLCEQAVQLGTPGVQEAENYLFQQAAAQGQSIFSAAGDTGSDDCNSNRATVPPAGQNPLSVDDPSSQPYVVAAGGTTIDDAATQPPQEHVWNDGASGGGGGGGISQSWSMPAWQLNSRVPGIVLPGSSDYKQANAVETRFGYPTGFCESALGGATGSTPCRTLPDVSADADEFTGAVTIYAAEFGGPGSVDGGWITIGGTSSAAPIWSAMLAVINASSTCQSNSATASGVGFVSPLLYAVASNPAAYKASFNDITTGNNDIYGLDNGLVYPAATGYDMASGLGSPRLTDPGGTAGLAAYLCSYASAVTRPAVIDLSPAELSTSGGTVTILGWGFESGGKPDVAEIQVGNWQIPSSKFTVTSDNSITATFPPASDTTPPGSPAPQDGAGPTNVIVTLKNGQSSSPSAASRLQYVNESSSGAVPSITGLSPTGGPEVAPTPVKILGSGFTGTSAVTFGGVAASSFEVISPFEIQATPPAYSGATKCAPSLPGETPTTDICQVQVQVTGPHGTSTLGQILAPLEGTLPPQNPMAVFELPPGCNCEQQPAPTEFDYVPAPKITSVSTSPADPGSLASENGGTVVTLTGKGFNLMDLDWVDFGDPSLASSQDFSETYVSGTEIQIVAPPQALTTEPFAVPVSVKSLAGQSPGVPVTYAGVPNVTSAINTATGHNGAADTGGAPLAITGQGFDQAVGPIEFADTAAPLIGTQYTYTVRSDSSISTQSVAQAPGLVDVEVCSVTACSLNPPADYFYLYPPGNPVVSSVSPTSGPAAGGTAVTISGENLGCVTGVFFGKVAAETFSNQQALLDCGSTTTVNATSPPGKSGSKVKVTVTTVESDFTGSGRSKSSATFTYTP
jgi:pro-kumamolisin-like protein/IPT/TIG domain-containing protein